MVFFFGALFVSLTIVFMISFRAIIRTAIAARTEEILDSLLQIEKSNSLHNTQVNVLWEGTSIPCFLTDETGVRTIKVNQAYLDLWDFRHRSQAMTDEWLEQLSPDLKDVAIERMSLIASKHQNWVFDNQLKDGRTFRFIGYAMWEDPIKENGFLGYSGCVLDLGKRDGVYPRS